MDLDILGGIRDFFSPVISFFNFIGSVLSTVIDGISGLTSIITSIINLLINITKILPSPLYPCLLVFLGVYSTILIYKIIREG